MRRWLLVLGILAGLGSATVAEAASHFDWEGNVSLGGAYVSLQTTDPGSISLEDLRGQETLGNTLTFDNAFLHLSTYYAVTAVQLKKNTQLNYLDHSATVDMDVSRWLQRHTDGRLTITASVRVSPSLPPLQTPESGAIKP